MEKNKKPSIYLETSVISYLVGRFNPNPVNLRKQVVTRNWWEESLLFFDPVISTYVTKEISEGDGKLAETRMRAAYSFRLLHESELVENLAIEYLQETKIPPKAKFDALHIACATIYRIDYLVTWNCAHINNGFVRKIIEKINDLKDLKTPVICTPEELMEEL